MEQVEKLIPNRLRKLRFHFGYSQKQVAHLIGVRNASEIGEWEQGTKMPTASNLLKLCAVYRTSCNDLYYDLVNQYKQEITMKEHTLFDAF